MARKIFTDESLATFVDEVKSYTDNAVSGKANASHSHSISNVTNLQSSLDTKVPTSRTVNGKALSANITLSASDVGAAESSHTHSSYVNQNAFSNVVVGSTTIAADTTTDSLTIAAGTGISVSGDATNDKVTITNSGVRSIATGSSNGTISVNTNGTSANVAVKGLGSAAYTASTAYDASGTAQTKADAALASAKLYTDDKIALLMDNSSEAVDSIMELATAMAENDDVVAALEDAIGTKANASHTHGNITNAGAIGTTANKAVITTTNGVLTTGTVPVASGGTGATTAAAALTNLGLTATAAELNKMDGVTATTTELNYVDGVTSNIQTQLDGKAASGHTHSYAGSSSAGGAATSANKINTDAGSATNPVYFANGIPVKTTYTLGKSVPSDAKFTDTTYSNATTTAAGLMSLEDKTKLNYTNVAYGTCSTAAATAEKVVTVSGNTQWALTVGSMVAIYFSNTNSASSVKLNVNGTGAYPIWYNNAEYTSTGSAYTGYAKRVITYMFNGTHWVWISSSYDANSTYSNAALGQGYVTCSTAEATVAKVGTLSSYSLTTGGIVSVKFTYAVPASATLNINSKGAKAIYYKGVAITAGIIKAGDIATFIYNGSQYHLISIDRWQADIVDVQTQLDGKSNSDHTHSAATTSANGFMSSTDKSKLDGIDTGANKYTHPTTSGNKHIPSGGSSGQILRWSADGTAAWGADNNTTYGVATSSALGLIKSGTDITVDSSGNVSVNDDSHNHVISNIDNLQTTLDGKQATITGGASTIASSNLTASRALISNSSGKVAVSAVTSTELGYLDGVTSNIQTQLDSKKSIRTARLTVGTSTSGWTSADCDYLCDGASDQTEINAAITALPSTGGEVVLLDGTYDISGEIKLNKANVTLRGNGANTKIGVTTSYNTNYLVVNVTGSNCTVRDLYINPSSISSTATCIMLGSSVSNCIIENNACVGGTTGIVLNSGQYNRISNNFIQAVRRTNTYGIDLRSGSTNDTIIGNTCVGNGYGIAISGSTSVAISKHTIADNICSDGTDGLSLNFANNCTITGNTCNDNYSAGIYFRGNNNTVSGNTCYSNVYGIQTGSTSNSNTITGNTARESTSVNMRLAGLNNSIVSGNNIAVLSTDEYTDTESLELYSTSNNYNTIIGNHLGMKNYTSEGGTDNRFVNNHCDGVTSDIQTQINEVNSNLIDLDSSINNSWHHDCDVLEVIENMVAEKGATSTFMLSFGDNLTNAPNDDWSYFSVIYKCSRIIAFSYNAIALIVRNGTSNFSDWVIITSNGTGAAADYTQQTGSFTENIYTNNKTPSGSIAFDVPFAGIPTVNMQWEYGDTHGIVTVSNITQSGFDWNFSYSTGSATKMPFAVTWTATYVP